MPEPSETSRDKESRPDPSGFWHRKSRPAVPTLACSKEEHLNELWPANRTPGLPQSWQLHQINYNSTTYDSSA
eukprot:5181688-Pleurochrysis_carterae.AAC.1